MLLLDYLSTIPITTIFKIILLIIEKGKIFYMFYIPLKFLAFREKRPLIKGPGMRIIKEKGGVLCQIN